MIWSLVPCVEQFPYKFSLKFLSLICNGKFFLKKKIPPYFIVKTICHCPTEKYREEVDLNLLTYWSWITWWLNDKRSLEWGIIKELECSHSKPLWALHLVSLILCRIKKNLQNPLSTKAPGQFIEVHKNQFFQRLENLIWDCKI